MASRLIQEVIRGRVTHTVTTTTTVLEAAQLMARERIGALLVLDGERLAGIFTERDALVRVLAQERDPAETSVADVMSAKPMTIRPDKPLAHALLLMYEGGFRHLPVSEAGRVLGVVSVRDALGPEMTEFTEQLQQFEQLAEHIR